MARETAKQLNAFYYPYADVKRSNVMMMASLYFDNIYVLEPNFFYPPEREAHLRLPGEQSMLPLIEAGVIKSIGPDLLGLNMTYGFGPPVLDPDNVRSLLGSIRDDLRNDQLRALTDEWGYTYWSIPTGQQLFWNGLGLLLETAKSMDISKLHIRSERAQYYEGVLESRGYGRIPVKEGIDHRVRVARGELEVHVPFLEAESLMIGVSLLACVELGLCPLTDTLRHQEFLCRKIANAPTSNLVMQSRESLALPLRETSLALGAISTLLPRVEGLTAESVLKIREKCGSSLERYRAEMGKLRHSVEHEAWSPEFRTEIQRVVDVEIQPAVREIEDRLTSGAKEFGIKLLADSAKLSPVPLLASLATGLPMEVLFAASGGLLVLKDYLEHVIKSGKEKRNGLFFLIDMNA